MDFGANGAFTNNTDIDINISGNNNQVLGCYIGSDITGSAAAGTKTFTGVNISGANNSVGNGTAAGANLIFGMNNWGSSGITITGAGATGNSVKGNMIGLEKDGSTTCVALFSSGQLAGVSLISSAAGNTIGGTGAGEGNVLSGNSCWASGYGVYVTTGATGNIIMGNIIGPRADGVSFVTDNQQSNGVFFNNSSNNTLGGNTAGARNIISGNTGNGIFTISGTGGNIIQGNYIGLDKNGVGRVGSTPQSIGININDANNTIGGTGAGEGNVISGNKDFGVEIVAAGNSIMGNIIGPQANGVSYVAGNTQAYGITIISGDNNVIGGNTAGARNIISANEYIGLWLTWGTGQVIKGNYIGLDQTGTTFIAGSTQDYGVYAEFSSGNTIGGDATAGEGNVISGNSNAGINALTAGPGGNTIVGNIIGPQANGTSYLASNVQSKGINISSSPNNTIGGNSAGARNIISANEDNGVYITGATSTGNVLKGNYIGLDENGTTFISGSTQDYGINITSSAASNTIGGSGANEGNVISGNKAAAGTGKGIYLTSTAAAGNTILGNIIGPQSNGVNYVASNSQAYGVWIEGSPNNTIGGNSAGARNIISANEITGISISGAGATGNVMKGNYIGLDANGTTFISGSAQDNGIFFSISAPGGNSIGGSGAGEGNVISGNSSSGIFIASTAGNTILGNIIGPQGDGVTYLASNSQNFGINITSSPNNTIGGNSAGARNIISANETYGVYIGSAGATGNIVKGNYIGLDENGTTFISGSTQDYGVYIGDPAASNTIGGSGANEGNVISGNKDGALTGTGIALISYAAAGNTVLGNIIGTQADGVTYLASNAQAYGVYIEASPNNTIGGNSAGARNIISANEFLGVYIGNAGATGNVVKGNYIGLDENGTTFISGSTQDYGVYIGDPAASNTIGGSGANEGNVISGNKDGASTAKGIYTNSAAAAGNTFLGNIIGPQADGVTYLASNAQTYGVYIDASPNNTIGGNSAGARNIISANENYGVYITAPPSTGNVVKGNYIGLDENGTTFITGSTQDYGVYITASAASNTIGGSGANEGNVISGNKDGASTGKGIYTNSSSAAGNTILGNIIGPQADGITYLASNAQTYGVYIDASPNNTIGGNSAGARNIISANEKVGVHIFTSSGNVLKGNYIGPGSSLANITGSGQDSAIYIDPSPNNIIGGTGAGEGNTIAFNTAAGIFLTHGGTINNRISGNLIYSNTGKAIDLNGVANGPLPDPTISTWSTALITGTGLTAGDEIEVFKNTTGSDNDAASFVGTAIADGAGNWSLVVSLAATDYVVVTRFSAGFGTSGFSTAKFLPIELLSFTATPTDNKSVLCQWTTATEINNDYFTLERSPAPSEGVPMQFTAIGTLKGAGNSSTIRNYEFTDSLFTIHNSQFTIHNLQFFYYRLKQTDFDGKYSYSEIVAVKFTDGGKEPVFTVFPNPSDGKHINVKFTSKEKNDEVLVVLNDINGNIVFSKVILTDDNGYFLEAIDPENILAAGVYFVVGSSRNDIYSRKLVIK